MIRADLKHCGKMPDAREELNRSVREGRIESRHSIKRLEGMGSSFYNQLIIKMLLLTQRR